MNKLEQEVKSICEEHASNYDGMDDFISDLHQGGCQSGLIGSLCYYSDTTKFHDDFEEEIWDLVYDTAKEQGINVTEFIASLNGSENVGRLDQLKNLLTWFAFEETSFRLFDNK